MNWIKEDFSPNSDSLIICLSSFFGVKNDPNKWEWEKSTGLLLDEVPFKRIFFRDNDKAWYQTRFKGIDGYGPHNLAKFLSGKIKESGAKRVLMMGISMGAYGALMFGCLCKADLVLSISPQTYFTAARWKKNRLEERFAGLNVNLEETDLKVFLERYNNHYTKYNIYYGKLNTTDTKMAERLKEMENVELFPLNSDKHTVVGPLRTSGELRKILLGFINK